MTSGVLILGAGGHGKVIADILLQQGTPILGFLDDDPTLWGSHCLGLPIHGGIAQVNTFTPSGLIIGIGHNSVRQHIVNRLGEEAQPLWTNAIHPRATLAPSVTLGRGIVVAAGAVINPDTVIGDHAVINTAASIDHDCTIARYAHVAPGAHLAGGVQVGEGTLIGIGASVIPYRTIGSWVTIGAGAVVVNDIPDNKLVKGIPAR